MSQNNQDESKQHGGHNAGKPSSQANGSGPLWDARHARGWTRTELSNRAQVGLSTIQRAEQTGDWPPTPSHKEALLRALLSDTLGWNTITQTTFDLAPQAEEKRFAVEVRTTKVDFRVEPPFMDTETYLVKNQEDGVMLLHEAMAVDWILTNSLQEMASTTYNLHEFLAEFGFDGTRIESVEMEYQGSPTPAQAEQLNLGRPIEVSRIGPRTRDFLIGAGRWRSDQ